MLLGIWSRKIGPWIAGHRATPRKIEILKTIRSAHRIQVNGGETLGVLEKRRKEELYRRLAQARSMVAQPIDRVTKERLQGLIHDLEKDMATIEARHTDAPNEGT